MSVSLAGISMPIFWLGLMLILLFSYFFPVLPSTGRLDVVLDLDIQSRTGFYLIDTLLAGNFTAFRNAVSHLILPAITLGTIPLAIIARMTRSSLLEVLNQPYITTAYAKGLSRWKVIGKHAMKNSMVPVLTIIGLEFGYLLGGAILTEHIFSWPGLGSWLRAAVEARDVRAVQGGVIFVAAVLYARQSYRRYVVCLFRSAYPSGGRSRMKHTSDRLQPTTRSSEVATTPFPPP